MTTYNIISYNLIIITLPSSNIIYTPRVGLLDVY